MHAHHKNLLRDFWLISPGKTPTGKTSQRGEIFIILQQNKMDRNTGEIQLISTQNLSQSLDTELNKKNPAVHLDFWTKNLQTVPLRKNRTSSNKCAVHLDFCAVINDVRTAINAARTVNKTSISVQEKCLENSAEVNASVQQQGRTLPRFLCW